MHELRGKLNYLQGNLGFLRVEYIDNDRNICRVFNKKQKIEGNLSLPSLKMNESILQSTFLQR